MFKKTNKKGFTLIELIVVVAIMAVLVALLAPNVLKYLEKSKFGKDIQSLDAVRTAVEAELMDERFSSLSTGDDSNATAFVGYWLTTMDNGNATTWGALYGRIFNDEDPTLSEAYENDTTAGTVVTSSVFVSKAAQGCRIAVFIDAQGGVAVAGVDATDETLGVYNGQQLFVASNIENFGTLTLDVQDAPAA